jgi:hypothetical protein
MESGNLHPTTNVSPTTSHWPLAPVPLAGKGVTRKYLLGAKHIKKFANVVYKANYLHPVRLSVTTHGLCGLEEMFNLGETGIGIRVINKGIEHFHRGPHTHPGALLLAEGGAYVDVELDGLLFCSIQRGYAINVEKLDCDSPCCSL